MVGLLVLLLAEYEFVDGGQNVAEYREKIHNPS